MQFRRRSYLRERALNQGGERRTSGAITTRSASSGSPPFHTVGPLPPSGMLGGDIPSCDLLPKLAQMKSLAGKFVGAVFGIDETRGGSVTSVDQPHDRPPPVVASRVESRSAAQAAEGARKADAASARTGGRNPPAFPMWAALCHFEFDGAAEALGRLVGGGAPSSASSAGATRAPAGVLVDRGRTRARPAATASSLGGALDPSGRDKASPTSLESLESNSIRNLAVLV